MDWIRNGKKYDTETAELIWKGYKYVDVPFGEERKTIVSNFYKKRSGECFLVVETKRGSFRNERDEREPEITTFTEEEAKKYAEENLSVKGYERAFGEVEE